MELELSDEDEIIPYVYAYTRVNELTALFRYQMASCFMQLPVSEVLKIVQSKNDALETEMDLKSSRMDECREKMAELKVALKGKFGNAINLVRFSLHLKQ